MDMALFIPTNDITLSQPQREPEGLFSNYGSAKSLVCYTGIQPIHTIQNEKNSKFEMKKEHIFRYVNIILYIIYIYIYIFHCAYLMKGRNLKHM